MCFSWSWASHHVTLINILQPTEHTLENTVLMEEISSSVVLTEGDPSFTTPFMKLHFQVINKEALKLTRAKSYGTLWRMCGLTKPYRILEPVLKESPVRSREIKHFHVVEAQGG